MKITITKAQAEKIGMKALVPFTGEKDSWGYRGEREVNLIPMGELVADNRGVSGRDVKNLLKLSLMTGAAVTVDTVRFVRQFQPTKAAAK